MRVPPELRDNIRITGLLQPPRFAALCSYIAIQDGEVDGLIMIQIYHHDLDMWNVYVTIKTEQGELIESGNAEEEDDEMPGLWAYVPTAYIPSGTTVIIQVFATDRLGAVGTVSEVIVVE
jgi:hypothetical protein